MSPPVRPIPFWTPKGIDGRAVSDSPWELLVNVFPCVDGWRSFGGWRRCSTGTPPAQRFLAAQAFYDGHESALIRVGLDEAARLYYFEVADGRGDVRMHSTTPPGFEPVESIDKYASTALNGRMFFSADGRTLCCTALDGDDSDLVLTTPVTPDASDGGLYVSVVDFRDGVNSDNYPYIQGDFGAPVLESHNGVNWYGGFSPRHVTFESALSPEQRFLDPDFVTNATTVRLNAQCLAYTDPNDPFAISLANFEQIPTKYPIKALVSWNDTLYAITTGDIWAIAGLSVETIDFNRIAEGVGCQDAYSACATAHGVVFADRNGIWLCDGETVKSLTSTIDHLFTETTPVSESFVGAGLVPLQLAKTWGGMKYVASREEVWCPVSVVGDQGEFQYLLVFSFRLGTWTVLTGPGDLRSGWDYIEAIIPLGNRIFAVSGKNIYEAMLSAGTEDSVSCFMVTKPILIEQQMEQMVIGANWMFRSAPVDGKLSMWGAESFADGDEQYGTFTIPIAPEWAVDGRKWGTGKWGGLRTFWTADRSRTVRMDFLGRSGYWRMGLACTSQNPMWLRGMELLVRDGTLVKG